VLLVTQEVEVKQAGEVRTAADGGSSGEVQDHEEIDKSTGTD